MNCTNWQPKEVANCSETECPLHWLRTGGGEQDAKKRNRSIRDYCLWCMKGKRLEVSKCPSQDCPLWAYRKAKADRSIECPGVTKKEYIGVAKTTTDAQPIPRIGLEGESVSP